MPDTPRPPRVVVVDLDGTLIRANSFRKWLAFLAKRFVRRPRALAAFALVFARRLARRTDRLGMKREVMALHAEVTEAEVRAFAHHLARFLDEACWVRVRSHLADPQNVVVLCTAAPERYARPFASALGFEHVLATRDVSREPWQENFGRGKVERLRAYLSSLGMPGATIAVVYSDDRHDLPLMREAREVILVSPKASCLEAIRAAGAPVTAILGAVRPG